MKTYSFLSCSGLYINFKFREKAVKTPESPLNCLWELSALNNCLNWDNLQHKMTQSLEISYACKSGIKCATPPQTFNLRPRITLKDVNATGKGYFAVLLAVSWMPSVWLLDRSLGLLASTDTVCFYQTYCWLTDTINLSFLVDYPFLPQGSLVFPQIST